MARWDALTLLRTIPPSTAAVDDQRSGGMHKVARTGLKPAEATQEGTGRRVRGKTAIKMQESNFDELQPLA
jgi:hypothetical protein